MHLDIDAAWLHGALPQVQASELVSWGINLTL